MFDFLETENNYFAKREGLRTQYLLLVKYDELRLAYTENKESLKNIMETVLNDNKSIAYEAFLLLSLFILSPHYEGSKTANILYNNRKMLFDFIGNF